MLRVTFFDDSGLVVQTFEVTIDQAAVRAAEFIRLHGDVSGRIEFSPID